MRAQDHRIDPRRPGTAPLQLLAERVDLFSMASIVPRRLSEKLAFFQAHLEKFEENAAEIGLSEEEVVELEATIAEAKAARLAQGRAQLAARSATLRYNMAMDALAKLGGTLILKVRAKATADADPSVYLKASIPEPAKRAPLGAPGTPHTFASSVDAVGQITIQWDCDNPKGSTGTTYQVRRRLAPDQPFEFIGITGVKKFVDSTVPAGVTAITYDVRAIRSTAFGKSANFNVNFGSNGMKQMGEFVPSTQSRQLAA